MNEISVSLALLDFVPVALCGIVVIVLLKDFYSRMTAWQYSFFSAGSFILIFGGFLKAVQKLIYALEICDLAVLKEQFFLNQSLAFIFLVAQTFLLAGTIAMHKAMQLEDAEKAS